MKTRDFYLPFAIGSIIIVAGLLLARFIPSPVKGLSMDDLRHDPWRYRTPQPVKLEISTLPPQMDVYCTLGWESRNSRKHKRFYKLDVEREYLGRTPLVTTVVDRGYSHVEFEFVRGENSFTERFREVPRNINENYQRKMHYPRLRKNRKQHSEP